MESRSRKVTYKQKRKMRRTIQGILVSSISFLILFFLYQHQTIEVDTSALKNETVKKVEPVIKEVQPEVIQATEVKQETVEIVATKQDTKKTEVKADAPVSPPIVDGDSKKEESKPAVLPVVNGVVVLSHKVKSKETLYSISKQYYKDDKLEYLLRYNGISDPSFDVKEGAVIHIPNPNFLGKHVIQKGETLFSVGKAYYSKSKMLEYMLEVNRLTNSSGVKEGAALVIFNQGKLTTHIVKRKETLYGIMTQYYQFTALLKLIQNSNNIGEQVSAGQKLTIPNPYFKSSEPTSETEWSLEILLNNHTLTIYIDGKSYKKYSAATGKESLTPKGTFEIITKFKNPEYTPKKIAGGNPLNPLGTRWLGLNVPGTTGRTYGIHGTSDPNSIGKGVSAGCIRLNNAEIEQLFELIPIGTKVVIK